MPMTVVWRLGTPVIDAERGITAAQPRSRYVAALVGILGVLCCCCPFVARAQAPTTDAKYVLGPDSRPQAGVPKGELIEFTLDHGKVFPGTSRKVTVYIPSEYTGD